MNVTTWCRRLQMQLPGWRVWHASPPAAGWYAVPAPDGTPLVDLNGMPNRIGPFAKPQDLRMAAHERYGWNDTCETCGVLARECGHRQPEREQ
jgi:hypothetical protein